MHTVFFSSCVQQHRLVALHFPYIAIIFAEDAKYYKCTCMKVISPSFIGFCLCFSGTTWVQEILPPLLNGGDLTSVETIPNWDRVPWLEETRASVVLDKLHSPRALVSHMPYNLMPSSFFKSKAKVQKAVEESYLYIVCRGVMSHVDFECSFEKTKLK